MIGFSHETKIMSIRISDHRVNHNKGGNSVGKLKSSATASNISLPVRIVENGTDKNTGNRPNELTERTMTVGDLKKRYELQDVVKQVTMSNNNNNNNNVSAVSIPSPPVTR